MLWLSEKKLMLLSRFGRIATIDLSQLRSAVLIGLTRGIFSSTDRLCCIGGLPQSNQFDSITVVDVEREFDTTLASKSDMLPVSVKPEVIERVLAIATELAVEGREGYPVGCLFTLGNSELISNLRSHSF